MRLRRLCLAIFVFLRFLIDPILGLNKTGGRLNRFFDTNQLYFLRILKKVNNLRFLFVVTDDVNFTLRRLALAQRLVQKGFQVAVACQTDHPIKRAEEWSVSYVYPLPLNRASLSLKNFLTTSYALRRALLHFKPNLIQTAGLRPMLIAWLASIGLRALSFVHLISGMGSLFTSRKLNFKLKGIRAFYVMILGAILHWPRTWTICQNSDDLDWIQNKFYIRASRLILIPGSGIDPTKWVPKPEPEENPFRIIFVGRLIEDKGLRDLVQALGILRRKGLSFRASVVGNIDPGNPYSLTREEITKWVNDGIIEWLGHRDDVLSLISAHHILVLPSTYGEGLPNVLLEAGLAERAVVAYDHTGARQAILNEVHGLLVPSKDIHALANAIERLVASPSLRKRLANALHMRVLSEFSDPVIHQQYLKLYKHILKIS